MLSREIHTTLGGRFMAREIYPFSFAEFLAFHNAKPSRNWQFDIEERSRVAQLFAGYFQFGGFAETFSMNDKRGWTDAIYKKILLGDIMLRNDIRNERALSLMAKKLAENVLQPMSLDRLKAVLSAAGAPVARATLADYIAHIEAAYLVFGVPNYTAAFAEKETVKKRYFWDNGLLNIFLADPFSRLLENLCAITLRKRYGDALFHYRRGVEVDFFIPDAKRAVQVCWSLSDDTTRHRELRALHSLAKTFDVTQLEIVTRDEEETLVENGVEIRAVPIWKWLLAE